MPGQPLYPKVAAYIMGKQPNILPFENINIAGNIPSIISRPIMNKISIKNAATKRANLPQPVAELSPLVQSYFEQEEYF